MCYGAERDYSPCMSACPKTCENFNSYDKIKSNCPYACVEGCSCSDGMVSNFIKYFVKQLLLEMKKYNYISKIKLLGFKR